MNSDEFYRRQIRRAIRTMSGESIFYLLDDAISLLSPVQLRQLIAPYANLEQFITHDASREDLPAEALAFEKASLAGEYYEETPISASNREQNSRGTLCWIADFRRLLDRCVVESNTTSAGDVCRAFEILFGLLDSLDNGTSERILFSEEGGSWMVGVDWKRVLPAWFQVLAATAGRVEFRERVETMIGLHCYGEQAEMTALACRTETPRRQGLRQDD